MNRSQVNIFEKSVNRISKGIGRMTFEINIKGKSLKFISSLQKHDRERLKETILVLKEDPVPIKALVIGYILINCEVSGRDTS